MKKLIRTIGILFTIVKVSAGTVDLDQDPYLSDNIVTTVQDISISKLLEFKKSITFFSFSLNFFLDSDIST